MSRLMLAFLLVPVAGICSIAVVQPASGSSSCVVNTCSGGGSGTKSVTLASTPAVGNTVVVLSNEGSNNVFCNDNQTPSNVYYGQALQRGSQSNGYWFAPVVTASGTFTVTCNLTGGSNLFVFEVSGLSGYLDGFSRGTGITGTTYNCGSITTNNPTDIIFSIASDNASNIGTITAGAGFTMLSGHATSRAGAVQYQITSTTGTFANGISASGASSTSECMMVAIEGSPITTYPSGTPARIQSHHLTTGSPNFTFVSNPSINNVLVVSAVISTNGDFCEDNQGNAYYGPSQNKQTVNIYTARVLKSSGTFTVSCTFAFGGGGAYIDEWSNVLPKFDTYANGSGSTPYACGTLSTGTADTLLLALVEDTNNVNASPNLQAVAPFSLIGTNSGSANGASNSVSGLESDNVTSSGSYSPTMSSTGQSASNQCISVALVNGSFVPSTIPRHRSTMQ